MNHTILLRNRVARFRRTTILLLLMLGCLMAASCLSALGGSSDPLNSPRFLTPVAEAQSAGVTTYWMGEEFRAGSLLFELSEVASAFPVGDDYPGILLQHGADLGSGRVVFMLQTFPSQSGSGADLTRERVEAVPGWTSEEVAVGPWRGELFVVPGDTRPVNRLFLFVQRGDMTVVAVAGSGRSGIPGDDPNPLLDTDLLIEVVAEHLRPYPQ